MKAIIMELGMVGQAADLIRRRLFPDSPDNDHRSEKVLTEELTILLSLYLNLNLSDIDIDYLDECDYYYECAVCFDDLIENALWKRYGQLPLKRIEVLDASGVVVLWPDQPKPEPVRHEHFKQTGTWQRRIL